jgi:hypothetical protein
MYTQVPAALNHNHYLLSDIFTDPSINFEGLSMEQAISLSGVPSSNALGTRFCPSVLRYLPRGAVSQAIPLPAV